MSLFILQNQAGEFLNKHLEWVPGCDARDVFHSPHKDVALNQLVELTARDTDLRARVVACEVDDKGLPRLSAARSAA